MLDSCAGKRRSLCPTTLPRLEFNRTWLAALSARIGSRHYRGVVVDEGGQTDSWQSYTANSEWSSHFVENSPVRYK